jgi:hypothetical protein
MSFTQLTGCEGLRDIENCLTAFSNKLYHCVLNKPISKSTLEDAIEKRNWRIYTDFAICTYLLIAIVKKKLNLAITLYTFAQTLGLLCLKRPLTELFSEPFQGI